MGVKRYSCSQSSRSVITKTIANLSGITGCLSRHSVQERRIQRYGGVTRRTRKSHSAKLRTCVRLLLRETNLELFLLCSCRCYFLDVYQRGRRSSLTSLLNAKIRSGFCELLKEIDGSNCNLFLQAIFQYPVIIRRKLWLGGSSIFLSKLFHYGTVCITFVQTFTD